MPRRYFGTDGVRGVVGRDLTPDLVERVGRAIALWSGSGRIFVGRDTRGSGPELEEALTRGIVSAGGAAVLGGVLPSPAVALLAAEKSDGRRRQDAAKPRLDARRRRAARERVREGRAGGARVPTDEERPAARPKRERAP